MRTSRRNLIGAGFGLASLASHTQLGAQQTANRRPKLELLDFEPKSMLVAAESRPANARLPLIDVHTHVADLFGRRQAGIAAPTQEAAHFLDRIVGWMDRLNIQTLVNVTGGSGSLLKRNISWLEGKYPGRFRNCAQPDFSRLNQPGYPKWQAEELARAKESGAAGLKILKYLGLGLREQIDRGPLVKIDDPRFDPMWEAAGALNLPVFIHVSDPDAFFNPVDRHNERWEELANHPDWSFYGRDYPPKAELIAARNRVIARHRKTTFVGLHVANHPENLDEVSAWMETYPNLWCEIGARIGELGRQPRRARQFFEKYQDRIMFGTDATPDGKEVPQQDLSPAMYLIYFRFLETEDEYFDYAPSATPPQGRWRIYGIGLPEQILRKVYHDNAARLLGMKRL